MTEVEQLNLAAQVLRLKQPKWAEENKMSVSSAWEKDYSVRW